MFSWFYSYFYLYILSIIEFNIKHIIRYNFRHDIGCSLNTEEFYYCRSLDDPSIPSSTWEEPFLILTWQSCKRKVKLIKWFLMWHGFKTRKITSDHHRYNSMRFPNSDNDLRSLPVRDYVVSIGDGPQLSYKLSKVWQNYNEKTDSDVQLLIGLISSHKESPNFWHVISHFWTTLYWNHIVRKGYRKMTITFLAS